MLSEPFSALRLDLLQRHRLAPASIQPAQVLLIAQRGPISGCVCTTLDVRLTAEGHSRLHIRTALRAWCAGFQVQQWEHEHMLQMPITQDGRWNGVAFWMQVT